MKLLQCTKATRRNRSHDHRQPLSDLGRAAVEAAARATRISMDSAERAIDVQLEYAKGAIEQATLNARAVAQVKDVQELMAVRARIAENALENLMGYSRSLYEVASEAQSEYSRLAEERMARFQQAMTRDRRPGRASPRPPAATSRSPRSKSQLAAATAAFDSFTKAAKNMASYADAGVSAAPHGQTRK